MFLTIFTPTTDAASYIDEAIQSVPRDEHDRIEHLMVHDGGREFPDAVVARFPWVRVIRGPGRGATAAAALAIQEARGEFVFCLNSDDRMVRGSIAALARSALERPDVDVWTGNARIFEIAADGKETTVRVLEGAQNTRLALLNVLDDLPLMTARFIRRGIYERLGAWDARFSYCSDREFAIRMVMAGVRDAALDVLVSEIRQHDGSRTVRSERSSVPGYLAEHLVLARAWILCEDLPGGARNTFLNWHARETLRKIYYELASSAWTSAAATATGAFATDPTWPWRARTALGGWLRRRR